MNTRESLLTPSSEEDTMQCCQLQVLRWLALLHSGPDGAHHKPEISRTSKTQWCRGIVVKVVIGGGKQEEKITVVFLDKEQISVLEEETGGMEPGSLSQVSLSWRIALICVLHGPCYLRYSPWGGASFGPLCHQWQQINPLADLSFFMQCKSTRIISLNTENSCFFRLYNPQWQ